MHKTIMNTFIVIAFAAVIAVGCTSKDPGISPTITSIENEGKSVFRVNLISDPSTIDPALAVNESELLLVEALYETLVENQDGKIVPAMAQSWQYSKDGRELIIQLRTDLQFSDGQPVTPADVEYSLERLQDFGAASPYAPLLSAFIGGKDDPGAIEPVGSSSLAIRFEKPRRDFIELLAHPCFSIVNKETVQKGTFGQAGTYFSASIPVVGSGPLKMVEWVKNRSITLEPNQNYFSTVPEIERVEMVVDDTTLTSMYDFGTEYLDIVYLQTPEVKTLAVEYPSLNSKLHAGPTTAVYFLGINAQTELFKRIEVRQAVVAAIDVSKLMEACEVFVASKFPLRRMSRQEGIYTGDPRKIIESLGFTGDRKIPQLVLSFPPGELSLFVAKNIKQQLENSLGVSVKIKETLSQRTQFFDPEAHLSVIRWAVPCPSYSSFFPYFLGQGLNPFTYGNYGNETSQSYFEQIGMMDKPSQRDHYYGLISDIISQEMTLYGLVEVKNMYAVQDTGKVPNGLNELFDIDEAE